MRSGLKIENETVGTGNVAGRGDAVTVVYDLYLNRGDTIRSRETTEFTLGKRTVIAGLEYGVEGMRVGGRRKFRVSPHLAYRDEGVPDVIPKNAVLIFDIELIAVESNDTA